LIPQALARERSEGRRLQGLLKEAPELSDRRDARWVSRIGGCWAKLLCMMRR
jgi:hypothetical protein